MRYLISILFLLFMSCLVSFSQSITTAEYFFDTDPGIGNGIPITVTSGDEWEFTIPVTGLDFGFHKLSVRIEQGDTAWSFTETRMFFIKSLSELEEQPQLVSGEYFFDTDPGIGNGMSFTYSQGDTIEITEIAETTGLSPGFHNLSFRILNENEKWSHSESRTVYIHQETENELFVLAEGEYFFDTDPGVGNGTSFNFSSGDTIEITEIAETIGLSPGFHQLSFRILNENGKWSHSESRTVYINSETENELFVIAGGEYFFDTDPGIGNGTSFSLEEADTTIAEGDTIDVILEIPLTGIIPGEHLISFRVMNSEGIFSNAATDTFNIQIIEDLPPETPLPPKDITVECASEVPSPIQLTAIDDVDGEITVSPTDEIIPGECPNDYTIERTWTFLDSNENSISVSQNIRVNDNTPPVAICKDITVILDESGNAEINEVNIDNGSYDLCGTISFYINKNTFNCSDIGNNTVLLSVTDTCGNISQCEATINVEDRIPPEISCIASTSFSVDANQTFYIVQGTELDASAIDECGIITMSYLLNGATDGFGESLSGVKLNLGQNTVEWIATDENDNKVSCSTIITVEKRPTSLLYEGDFEGQYSDQVILSAILTDNVSGLGIDGKTIVFSIGTQTVSAITQEGGIADATITLNQMPAFSYNISTSFEEDESYLASNVDFPFEIITENALTNYIGTELTATLSTVNLLANIDLRTVIVDFTDEFRGDITNSTVQFVNLDNSDVILDWTPVSDLIDPFTGVVSYLWTAELTNTENAETFTIGINVNNYYSASEEDIITVYKPEGDFITGGGHIIPVNSAGLYNSDFGSKTNFGFNIKFNKTGKNLQGKLNFIWRSGGKTYQTKSNATLSLGVNNVSEDEQLAFFTSKCNVQDITDPLNPIDLGGNKTMQVSMTDRGEPGNYDEIAFTLWDGNILWYSSNWSGLQTQEILLNGGNVVVHSGLTLESVKVAEIVTKIDNEPLYSNLKVYPNPSNGVIYIEMVNIETPYTFELINIAGQVVVKKEFRSTEEQIDLRGLAKGIYLLKVYTQNFSKTEKLIIQ